MTEAPGRLTLEGGRLMLTPRGEDEAIPVTVRYLRPLTGRRSLVFLNEKQREVATVAGVEVFGDEARALLEEALAARYVITVIERIEKIDVQFGTRYWEVETDRGPRWFALREPGKNVTWLDANHLALRDVAGNRFEIRDVAALDGRSQRFIQRML